MVVQKTAIFYIVKVYILNKNIPFYSSTKTTQKQKKY